METTYFTYFAGALKSYWVREEKDGVEGRALFT
jgi:hypothetical protein